MFGRSGYFSGPGVTSWCHNLPNLAKMRVGHATGFAKGGPACNEVDLFVN